MYSTCLFCNDKLGRNEVIEHFPVGRRLAFDESRGRLWVVCKSCERWNLTPLEIRWEAIEACERQFRETKRRVSTDQIGLAKLREGLELIRIGNPLRPEMAAWRYGDQFGKRRRRYIVVAVAGAAAFTTGHAVLGFLGLAAAQPITNAFLLGQGLRRVRRRISIPLPDGESVQVGLGDVPKIALLDDGRDVVLRVPVLKSRAESHFWKTPSSRIEIDLHGEHAIRAAGALLPTLNAHGASAREVRNAVEFIEKVEDPRTLFRRAANSLERKHSKNVLQLGDPYLLKRFPNEGRVALEMVANEETERRALEGELHILEEMWRLAEEIAAISDDMFLSDELVEKLEQLKSRS